MDCIIVDTVLGENGPDCNGVYPGPGRVGFRLTAASYSYSEYQLRDVIGHNGDVGAELHAQENVYIHYDNVTAGHHSQVGPP